MGGLRQAPFRRPTESPAVSGTIHPPSSHFQRKITRPREWPGPLPLARLAGPQSDQRDVTGSGRVHPPVPPACAPQRVRKDPTFRIPFQPQSKKDGPALPRTPAAIRSGSYRHGTTPTTLPNLQSRPSLCDRHGPRTNNIGSGAAIPPSPSSIGLFIAPMIFVRQIADNSDCPIPGTAEVCRLTSFRSLKTASPTVFSIPHSQQCFIPPLITGPTKQACWCDRSATWKPIPIGLSLAA